MLKKNLDCYDNNKLLMKQQDQMVESCQFGQLFMIDDGNFFIG